MTVAVIMQSGRGGAVVTSRISDDRLAALAHLADAHCVDASELAGWFLSAAIDRALAQAVERAP